MELKPYQKEIITDLDLFLDKVQETKNIQDAFHQFWFTHPRTPLQPFPNSAVEPYKNNVKRTPHICVKVPTAGGKTFIACNALKTIFDSFDMHKTKAVVWLVPSITILEQTIRNLKNPHHPYRQRINVDFSNRVEVYDKQALLQGSSLNSGSVQENLSIFVMSFDSFRASNKEGRKVYQDNSNLMSFGSLLGEEEEISVMKVLQALNPVVVVDESHNAESDLSVEMLQNLNPCFILDLTATPRKNSNIISFTDAMALKKENMVKLPVIVYNHQSKEDVISSALQLQRKLEQEAKEAQKLGGKYIRPIVLFQAQPKTNDDNTTFEKIKETLIKLQIPEEQIKIKTANINEIKGLDLMAEDCPVRYIITVNALKEGWDCPFAYILASLADKSSAVDVEQILGRVLRLPYVSRNKSTMLNMSYVLTASGKFMDTLQNIVKGLNKAGFSDKDYRLATTVSNEQATNPTQALESFELFPASGETIIEKEDFDLGKITYNPNNQEELPTVSSIEQIAIEEHNNFDKRIEAIEQKQSAAIPTELENQVKTYAIKEVFKAAAESLKLPQFFSKEAISDIFNMDTLLFDKTTLLEKFPLRTADTNIDFGSVNSELYKVDLDETNKDYTPTFMKIDGVVHDSIVQYILDPAHKNSRIKNCTQRIMRIIGNMYPIPDRDIELYINRIFEEFTDEQFSDLMEKEYAYADKIRAKISQLANLHVEKEFGMRIDTDKIFIQEAYALPKSITPSKTGKALPKSLYEKEGDINGFEEQVINDVANLENIEFWTRNIEKRGFCINGFINHYPDFIIKTKKGKIILLETKGDHLDAKNKIKLGSLWESKAGNNYRYFMVYNSREVEGARTLEEFKRIVKDL